MSLVELDSTPSIGSILGNQGSQNFLDSINQELSNGSSAVYFGSAADRYKDHFQSFITDVITPIINTAQTINHTHQRVIERNNYMAIDSIEVLERGIPVSMELPIIMYEPIKNLLKEKSCWGFGYEYENIKDTEDVYGRLINNGCVTLNGDNPDEYLEWEWNSTDPIHTLDDIENISDTREFIDEFLENYLGQDYTDFPNMLGKIKG